MAGAAERACLVYYMDTGDFPPGQGTWIPETHFRELTSLELLKRLLDTLLNNVWWGHILDQMTSSGPFQP